MEPTTYECEMCGCTILETSAERHESWHADTALVIRDGFRGHYLAALFVDDTYDLASAILDSGPSDPRYIAARDYTAAYSQRLTELATTQLDATGHAPDWDSASRAYEACSADWPTGLDVETFQWWMESAESALSDMGYLSWWDDGYVIYRGLRDNELAPGEVSS